MKISFIILGISLIFFSWSCSESRNIDYPVKIEKVDNITFINNPTFPKNPPIGYYLKTEMEIGDEKDENYLFVSPTMIRVDESENIYVLDFRFCHIKKFNKEGKFLKAIGRKGEGPGELIFPINFIVRDKLIHILDTDNLKISKYHTDGTFDADLKLKEFRPGNVFFKSKDFYFMVYSFYDKMRNQKQKIIKYDLEGNIIKKSKDFLVTTVKIKKKKRWILSGSTPFDPSCYFTFDLNENIYYGFSDKYEIIVFDYGFNKKKVIRKKITEFVKVTESDKEKFLNYLKEREKKKNRPYTLGALNLPKYQPVFKNIWIDGRNNILVRTPSNDKKVHIDLFNNKGIYLKKLIINEYPNGDSLRYVFHRPEFNNGYIYSIVKDKNDLYLLKKYSLIKKEKK